MSSGAVQTGLRPAGKAGLKEGIPETVTEGMEVQNAAVNGHDVDSSDDELDTHAAEKGRLMKARHALCGLLW